MKLKSVMQFLGLYACLVFFIFVNLNFFWIIVAGFVAFVYFVAIKTALRKQIEKEFTDKFLKGVGGAGA
jgi:hypothetical protein